MKRRDYAGPADLAAMQDLTQRVWCPSRRFHVGDIAWGRYSVPGAEADFRTALWEIRGQVVAWGWVEMPAHLEVLVDPQHGEVLPELIEWFESQADGSDLACMVMEDDAPVIAGLERRGYVAKDEGPFFTRHIHDLVDLPLAVLPTGFSIHSVESGEAERRAAVHRAGWSDFGSRVSTDSYARLMATPPYRPETDLVVAAPDGTWVASALGWYDDVNRVGLVEPVSCAVAYRGRGLARAVNVALLKRFKDLGARSAVVLPRGDDAYPAPGRLYRRIGFVPGSRTLLFNKTR